jgi:hypothetical protein
VRKEPYFLPLEPGKRNILLRRTSNWFVLRELLSFLQGVDERLAQGELSFLFILFPPVPKQ